VSSNLGEARLVGSPLLQQGEPDFKSGEKNSIFKMGFSPGFSNAGAKARDPDRYFSGALKRSSLA
jgi:hypothetical protein